LDFSFPRTYAGVENPAAYHGRLGVRNESVYSLEQATESTEDIVSNNREAKSRGIAYRSY